MAAAPLVDALFADPAHWVEHAPDYTTLLATHGPTSGQDTAQCKRHIANLHHRTPTCVAFIVNGDMNQIYVGHSPTIYPGDPAAATPFDDCLVVLVGNDVDRLSPFVLPANCFTRATVRASTHDYMVGNHGHSAAPNPVFRFGPHGGAAADTDEVQVRPVFLLDPNLAEDFVGERSDGTFSLLGFYNAFIAPDATSGDAARETYIAPLLQWYRAACTNDATPSPAIGVDLVTSGVPAQFHMLQGWGARNAAIIRNALGHGGPALSNVAFNAGITNLQATLQNTSRAHLQYLRDAAIKTFTETYGASIAQVMYNLCNVNADIQKF